MEKHPIQGLMETSMQSIRDMVDVNTVLGDAVTARDGSTWPAAVNTGNGAWGKITPSPGARARGVTLQPVGFLVCGEGGVRMLPAQAKNSVDRVIDLLPGLMEEVKALLSSARQEKQAAPAEEDQP